MVHCCTQKCSIGSFGVLRFGVDDDATEEEQVDEHDVDAVAIRTSGARV